MQTFLPYPAMRDSLDALDNKRLNKQILETYQILKVLSGQSQSNAWRNHPAVLMWEGAENELWRYGQTAMVLAEMRDIKTDKNKQNFKDLAKIAVLSWGDDEPLWRKSPTVIKRVNATHKANLYRKDPIYYEEFADAVNSPHNQPCCEGCLYYWVTHPRKKK
jgi:Pyrimidine dimer DNA glycosylase